MPKRLEDETSARPAGGASNADSGRPPPSDRQAARAALEAYLHRPNVYGFPDDALCVSMDDAALTFGNLRAALASMYCPPDGPVQVHRASDYTTPAPNGGTPSPVADSQQPVAWRCDWDDAYAGRGEQK